MESPPLAVHTTEQVRLLDQRTAAALGISSYALMQRAGAAAHAMLREAWPHGRRIAIVCGPGNNGGDGYVLARLARAQGLDIQVTAIGDPEALKGEARQAFADFAAQGGRVEPWSETLLREADVIVDAIFGTGLTRPLARDVADKVEAINAAGAPVLALDIPSGLDANTGHVHGAAVAAQQTLTFVALKLGFYVGSGPDVVGNLVYAGLGSPAEVLASVDPVAVRIGDDVLDALPPRLRTSHKGAHGRVLVIGGGRGMAGAARLAGEAALRIGAGLVTVATRAENAPAIVGARPELIVRGVDSAADLRPLIEAADVLALGPGLGQDEWAQALFTAAIGSGKPAIVDADGLNLLARQPQTSAHWALTPHPGEAARLLATTTNEIQSDRLGAVRALAARYGGVIVLKGAGTLVLTEGSTPAICDRGNPGMASAGMGDVLTGVIAGLAAQLGDLARAAQIGVLIHAHAGDLAAQGGERGLIASDLFERLRTCVNPGLRR
jgi:ADP-dependent NAD(P)H-hydrate dehydratase / NAD(P)H-hydrate epimerase